MNFRKPSKHNAPSATARAIVDVAIAVPHHFVEHRQLADARGVEQGKYLRGLGCHNMAVCAPGEDTVTLAATAAWRLLQRYPECRERIGMCAVGTETGVDHAKPISIFLHGLVGLPSSCRTFDLKHACYSGTAALQLAMSWAESHPDQLALVVAADVARYERSTPGEPTQGAGAVAMLVGYMGAERSLLEISTESGIYASEVQDFWRPNYRNTALVKGKFSVSCYLEGLSAAFDEYREKSSDFEQPDYMLFHLPFPNMARKAHTHLMKTLGVDSPEAIEKDFQQRVVPGMWANRSVGNIYSGSLYLSLAGLREREGAKLVGKTVGLFSYGSGSCSEYFTGRFLERCALSSMDVTEVLQPRLQIDVPTYEKLADDALALESDGSFHSGIPAYPGQRFSFLGIREHERMYRCNEEVMMRGDEVPLLQKEPATA